MRPKVKQVRERTVKVKEVFSLEEILEENLGFPNVFKVNGELTVRGNVGYELLVQIVLNLANIGVCRHSEAARMVARLERIKNEPDVIFDDE